MTHADQFLTANILRHRAPSDDPAPQHLRSLLIPILNTWEHAASLESIHISGSRAKGTALRNSDTDLFLSLSPAERRPLSEIQDSLTHHMRYYFPQPRNVSVRILIEGTPIDLVPARRHHGSTRHSLWQRRHNTWLQTDVQAQSQHIKSSGLIMEMLALKIWAREHALPFPSFLQELATIAALQPGQPISQAFGRLLHYLATDFQTARLTDPANSNNIVSDVLSPSQKSSIAAAIRHQTHESPESPRGSRI